MKEEAAIKFAKNEIEKAKLELEYATKSRLVNELPDCDLTEEKIRVLS